MHVPTLFMLRATCHFDRLSNVEVTFTEKKTQHGDWDRQIIAANTDKMDSWHFNCEYKVNLVYFAAQNVQQSQQNLRYTFWPSVARLIM